MPRDRDKYWDFSVSEFEIRPVIEPVIEAAYAADGDALVEAGLRHGFVRMEPIRRNERRRDLLAAFIQTRVWSGGVDFEHDPEHAEDPVISRDDLTRSLLGFFEGEYDPCLAVGEESARPLFNDDFADPAEITRTVEAIVGAVASAVADGRIEVTAAEPYDSCRGCGGYHNVNWNCATDDGEED